MKGPATPARISFVGAGQLGAPMVDRLVAAGHRVVVHARRPEAREELQRRGIPASASLEEVADGAELAVVCLFSDQQLGEVGPLLVDALPAGATVASHVTGSPAVVHALAQRGRAREVMVLDAPVSGTADSVRAGTLTVLLGGEGASADRCADVLRAYADPVLRTGPRGSALAVKLVNNLLFAATLQLLHDAVRLGAQLGVDEAPLLEALSHSSGSSHAVTGARRHPSLGHFGSSTQPFLRKDVAVCRQVAADLGVDPGLLWDVVRRGDVDLG
ncbi:MAG: 6-phosphogluconate dehydrogenase, NAD-binding protein [Frankiales bacterium]|nr:6-phosphogluconate dehydrogenase, NAD-binding protein [Frankiales bacterium]